MNPRFWLAAHGYEKLAEADTPVEVLRFVVRNPDSPFDHREAASRNPVAPEDVLTDLYESLLKRVTRNLTKHHFDNVILAIHKNLAVNPAIPSDLLLKLFDRLGEIQDASYTRREAGSTLWQHAMAAKHSATSNPRFPVKLMRELSLDGRGHTELKVNIASNPNAPKDILTRLAESGYDSIWTAAYKNLNLPLRVLEQHSKSKDVQPHKRRAAEQALWARKNK